VIYKRYGVRTYSTLDGLVVDLDALETAEQAFIERALAHYRAGANWFDLTNLIFSPANPLLAPGHQRGYWEAPAMVVLRDIDARLGIAQGYMRPDDGDEVDRDPLEDEFVTVSQAAALVGLTRMAVHKAAARGDLVATTDRPARISRRSLEAYRVSRRHVAAGRAARARTAAVQGG
jgi:hypothetical protein